MYGRVTANSAELKLREAETYRSHYCGLCRELGKKGRLCQFSLSYDMTFLALLLNSLYEPDTSVCKRRCICHPFKKHSEASDKCTPFVADMSVFLAYYKALDDFRDEKNLLRGIYALSLLPKVKKIRRKYGKKCQSISQSLSRLSSVEATASLEECANIFGNILGEIFTPFDDEWHGVLFNIGFHLGKFVYIADAYEDAEDDLKHNRPNPLKNVLSSPDFDGECKKILTLSAAEAADEFEKLPLIENIEIMRNIIYSGIWQKIEGDSV